MKTKLTDEQLEQMSYDDIAYVILTDFGKKMKIKDLFTRVVKLLKLTDDEYEKHIGDFFELLSTDKRFIMLENGFWDLSVNHSHKIKIENEDDDFIENIELDETEKPEEIEDEEDIDEIDVDPDDDVEENDLGNLSIITEDEEDML